MGEIILPNPEDMPGDGAPPATAEMVVQRQLTSAFIDTMPVFVELVPRRRIKTSAGGFKWVEDPDRDTQKMRLVEPGRPSRPFTGSDGQVREMEFMLLGEWDALIGQYDVFELDSRKWEVAELFHFNGWERRAAVIKYG